MKHLSNLLVCVFVLGVGIFFYDRCSVDMVGAGLSAPGTRPVPGRKLESHGGRFDQASLRTLQLYMEEIARRENEKSQREGIRAALERTLGSGVSEGLFEALADQVLLHQRRADDIKNGDWSPDEKGGTALRGALLQLREQYAAVLLKLVPADDVEKILQSRLTRFVGLPEVSSAEEGK